MYTETDTDITPALQSGHTDDCPAVTLVSHILSWVFSPLLTPTYGMIAIFTMTPLRFAPLRSIFIVISVIFSLTAILPGLTVWLLTRYGDVADMALTRRKDRLYPYIIIIAALVAAGFYLKIIGTQLWIPSFFWGAAAAAAICFIINYWWKISAHGAGMGGLAALFAVLTRYSFPTVDVWIWLLAAIAVCGLLASARVWLGRHTPMQTIAGTLVGFICVFITELI
ncbi:MAG: phosphatase PAP2 family protein [Muribaculaceae bacterium]|nr:phosphatase PAP2 family protein [Muribaculaceae bacterium]